MKKKPEIVWIRGISPQFGKRTNYFRFLLFEGFTKPKLWVPKFGYSPTKILVKNQTMSSFFIWRLPYKKKATKENSVTM